ncbi:TonB-dependent hemoglobin/transferrin/lactoferrin family receptor [Shinella sp. BYT-45]|uniref:TonB-dependent hemoglobin/transferrin/lactoferrin family receptor n=1 Tax=Shinella sp. BYT-45 TaxID=3377377 RepID=UPI0039817776
MQARRSRSALLACTALAALSLSAAAFAQDASNGAAPTGESTALQPVIVKGKRVKAVGTGVADTPLATTVSDADIESKQITSIEDLGRSLEPGVGFNRSTGAVNIRGLEGPRVLTTIDGIPVPYLYDTTRGSSGGVDSFDFSSLSAIDIMRGADSSRAGSGALGGALGLRTLEPEDLIGEGRDWGGVARFTYDSSDDSYSPSAAIAKRFDNTSVLFQGSYKAGGERDNKGSVEAYGTATRTLPNPSDYDQHNLLFKVRHHAESGHLFGVTAERFRKDRDTDARTSQSLTGNYRPGNYDTFEDNDRDRISLDYAYDGGGFFDSASASLYWLKQLRSTGYEGIRSTSIPLGEITRKNDYEEETLGVVGSAEKTFVTGALSHRVVMGLDIAAATAEQYSSGRDNCAPPYFPFHPCLNLHTNQADEPKTESRKIGFFVDDEIGLGQSAFYLTPGVRFDWVKRTPKMTDAFDNNASNPALPEGFSDTAISPKLRLAYRPSETLELYGQWAMGFRAPTAGELYSTFGGPGTYLRRGNADLKSETSNGFEIGARMGDDDFGGRISAFHNRYRNFIEAVSASVQDPAVYPFGITEFQNLNRVRITGVEFSVHKRFDSGFHVNGALAYAKGKNLETGTYLGSVAPLKAVLGVGYATETWGTDLTWIGVKSVSSNSDATFKAPGYGIVDLTAWWEPEQVEGLTVRAGVYNLFDKEHYDALNVRSVTATAANRQYYSEPGRSFKISLTQRF